VVNQGSILKWLKERQICGASCDSAASQEAGTELALMEVRKADGSLSFKVKDGDDVDEYQLQLTGDNEAELKLLVPANGPEPAPRMKPFKLTRSTPH